MNRIIEFEIEPATDNFFVSADVGDARYAVPQFIGEALSTAVIAVQQSNGSEVGDFEALGTPVSYSTSAIIGMQAVINVRDIARLGFRITTLEAGAEPIRLLLFLHDME